VSLSKLRNEKEQMWKDLESKISGSKKFTTSIHNRIENELSQENNKAYFSPCSVSFVLIGEYIQYSPLIDFRLIIPSNIHLQLIIPSNIHLLCLCSTKNEKKT
jgi:hypothetical protein